MRDREHDGDEMLARNEARETDSADEMLTVEPLDPVANGGPRGGRLAKWLAPRLGAGPGRRLSPRGRALRVGLVVTLVAATLFTLLGGPAAVAAGWTRLTSALGVAQPLAMTRWELMPPPPIAMGADVTYTPDPLDPARVYACAAGDRSVTVWRTDSSGKAWRVELNEPARPNSVCQVKVALDAPTALLVVIYARDPQLAGCQWLSLYSGVRDGTSWTPAAPPVYPDACLGDVWPSGQALYYWWTNAHGGQAKTGLARSDDQGATWLTVPFFPPDPHFSLAPALLSSGSANTIMTQVYTWPGSGQKMARNEVWRSLDGGFSWRRALNAPLGAQLLSTTEHDALTDVGWPPTYAVVFNGGELSPPWVPYYAPATIHALNPDGSTWTTLPRLPLPTSGAQVGAPPSGISAALAVGPGGSLLALGEKPGALATLNPQQELWLWAWDPAAHTWRAGERAPGGASLAGLTWASGPAGGPYAKTAGVYLWLTSEHNRQRALYRAFISTAQR